MFEFRQVSSLNIIQTGAQITKALISLHGCAGWSGRLLLACNKVRFSRNEAHSKETSMPAK